MQRFLKPVVLAVLFTALAYVAYSHLYLNESAAVVVKELSRSSAIEARIESGVLAPMTEDDRSVLIQKFNLELEQMQALRVNAAIITLENTSCDTVISSDIDSKLSTRTQLRILVMCADGSEHWYNHQEVSG